MTRASAKGPVAGSSRHAVATWTDPNTGRQVRQLTQAGGASLQYFRFPRHLPDGRMLALIAGVHCTIDPESGEHQPIAGAASTYLKLRESDGVLWTHDRQRRQVHEVDVIGGTSRLLCRYPDDLSGMVCDITCDGRTLIVLDLQVDRPQEFPMPTRRDPAMFWRYVNRPRRGAMRAYDVSSGALTTLVETEGRCPFHADTSPVDPTLVRFAFDHWEGLNQRVWTVRTDGSDLRPIRPQQPGELVTHEFWWPGGKYVGFTFQDRRNEEDAAQQPWCEYAHSPTQLGIADLSGAQVYLSDPVNHYHTHLYVSRNGKLISGSGTDGHSFVYAARFDWTSPRVDLVPLATIHTPYVPFRGQEVNCDFSADGKWLLYTDTVPAGTRELCAVRVDL